MATDADASHIEEELGKRNEQIEDLRDELRYARERIEDGNERTGALNMKIVKLEEDDSLWKRRVAEFQDKVLRLERENEEGARALASATSENNFEVQRLREQILKGRQSAREAQEVAEAEQRRATALEAEAGNAGGRLEAKRKDILQFQEVLNEEKAAEGLRQSRIAARKEKEAASRLEEARALLSQVSGEYAAQKARESNRDADLAKERECSEGLNVALRHTQEKREQLSRECDALEAELCSSRQLVEVEQRRAVELADVEQLVGKLNDAQRQRQRLTQELVEVRSEATFQLSGLQGAIDETRRMMDDHLDHTRRSPEAADSDPMLQVLRTQIHEERARSQESIAAARKLTMHREALEERQRQAVEDEKLDAESSLAQQRSEKTANDIFVARQVLEKAQRKAAEAREQALMAEAEVPDVRISSADREAALRLKLEELWAFLREVGAQTRSAEGPPSMRENQAAFA